MALAATLADALDVLDVVPLEFLDRDRRNQGSDPAFYEELPARDVDGLPEPGTEQSLRDKLLGQRLSATVFLSGHVGSGKSTQINRLAADEKIRAAFSVALLRIDADLIPFLDASQLLFLMAGAIFDFGLGEKLLSEEAKWKGVLRDLDAHIFGASGASPLAGTTSAELNVFFVKIRQDLKLSERRRQQFRDFGETERSILLDLLKALTLDIMTKLVEKGRHHSLLLLIDDLDKVADHDLQRDIFDKNLGSLLAIPFHVLYTVPTGVVFGPNRVQVRSHRRHLYPLRVLDRSPDGFDPERAFVPGSDVFFRHALDRRADPRLFTDDAVRLATIYSGGVLREFFRLLRGAVLLARFNKLDAVSDLAVRGAVRDERRSETMGLYTPDYDALAEIHRTHEIPGVELRHYLDEGRALECYNGDTWYEVNPLLWKSLEGRRRP